MKDTEEITDKELKFLENMRRIAIPYGDIDLRLSYQDGVIVLIRVKGKEETIKL